MSSIGFIGLGRMGAPIAQRLVAAGHAVTVYDLREDAVRSLASAGARPAASPAQVATDSEIILTCLPGPPELEATVFAPEGILQGLRPASLYIDLSSSSVSLARRIDAAVRAKGSSFLDAPISGGVTGARNGTLQLMVGGRAEDYKRALPLLLEVGNKASRMGEAGCGTVAKLAHNLAYIATRSVLAECFTMGVKGGVEPEALLEAVRGGAFGQGLLLSHFLPEMVFKGSFEPVRFAMRLAAKDVGLATGLARELDVPMPMGALTEQLLVEAMARGWGDKDYGTAFLLQEERAGVQVRSGGQTD